MTKLGFQGDNEIAAALAQAKRQPPRATDKVHVLRTRLSHRLGRVVERQLQALLQALDFTPNGYMFRSANETTIRALWHALTEVYLRPPKCPSRTAASIPTTTVSEKKNPP